MVHLVWSSVLNLHQSLFTKVSLFNVKSKSYAACNVRYRVY